MNFKRIFSFLMIAFLTVQFQWACDKEKKNDTNLLQAPVNDPKNNYEVIVEIISFGGINGCAFGSVEQNNQFVGNAEIKVNEVSFYSDTTSFFSFYFADTLNPLKYTTLTKYQLSVKHAGKVIAQGQAVMPSVPAVRNLSNPTQHSLNKALLVQWQKVEQATAIQVIVTGKVYNPTIKDTVEKEFDSGLLSPETTQITIPDTMFNLPGTYVLGIVALNGINPGMIPTQLYDENGHYQKSYNIEGAAGIFLAAMAYPDPVGLRIIVSEATGKSSLARPDDSAPRLKDMLKKKLSELTQKLLSHD